MPINITLLLVLYYCLNNPLLVLYCYYNRPLLPYLQLINPYYFISSWLTLTILPVAN